MHKRAVRARCARAECRRPWIPSRHRWPGWCIDELHRVRRLRRRHALGARRADQASPVACMCRYSMRARDCGWRSGSVISVFPRCSHDAAVLQSITAKSDDRVIAAVRCKDGIEVRFLGSRAGRRTAPAGMASCTMTRRQRCRRAAHRTLRSCPPATQGSDAQGGEREWTGRWLCTRV